MFSRCIDPNLLFLNDLLVKHALVRISGIAFSISEGTRSFILKDEIALFDPRPILRTEWLWQTASVRTQPQQSGKDA